MTAHAVAPSPNGRRGVVEEARYYREHVLPWLNRRVRGRSSGDDRSGKHPAWIPVDAMV